jgi:hypothetical protein
LAAGEHRSLCVSVLLMVTGLLVSQTLAASESSDPNLVDNWLTTFLQVSGYLLHMPLLYKPRKRGEATVETTD